VAQQIVQAWSAQKKQNGRHGHRDRQQDQKRTYSKLILLFPFLPGFRLRLFFFRSRETDGQIILRGISFLRSTTVQILERSLLFGGTTMAGLADDFAGNLAAPSIMAHGNHPAAPGSSGMPHLPTGREEDRLHRDGRRHRA